MTRRRTMIAIALPFLVLLAAIHVQTAEPVPAWLDEYRDPASRLIGAALADTSAWERLAVLTDTIGNRLSGTPQLDRAIQWAAAEMKRDGLENVHTERAMVPRWIRGAESAEIVEPARQRLVMLGLGNSVGTPDAGVQAEVLVVHTFEELDAAGTQARGRIVLFNVPFTNVRRNRALPRDRRFTRGEARRRRDADSLGRQRRPAHRRTPAPSITPKTRRRFRPRRSPSRTPTCIQRMVDRGSHVVVSVKMAAHFEADAESANVVGEDARTRAAE